MPTPSNPDVTQFGFTPAGGALQNLVDRDDATYWQPLADGFDAYTIPPVSEAGVIILGNPHPAIQFDFGDAVRIPSFRVGVETRAALGWCYLLASDLPATSVDDTVQSGDLIAGGLYTVEQMNSNAPLMTRAKDTPIRKRFWRFVFFKNPPAA